MQRVCFDTLGESATDRVEAWSQINREFFGPLAVDCLDDGPLDAQMATYNVGSLRMFRITAPAHRVRRDDARIETPMDGLYKLVLQLRGHGEIRQHDRAFHLRPGDWSLYDPRVAYSITNLERADLLAIQVPRQHLKGFKVPSLHTCEASSSNLIGLHAVLSSFLTSLSEQLTVLPDGVGQPLSETVLGLLASTLAAHQTDDSEHATLPGVLKARVKQYVQAHLGEADLTIERIALDLRCSKRYLHRVFEDGDSTLDRYIWQARLQRCHEALGVVGAPLKSISAVAYGWGFNSSAHFCRMFKSHYGMSPREYQRQAQRSAGSVRGH